MPSFSPKRRVVLILFFVALVSTIALTTHRLHHFPSSIALSSQISDKKGIATEASPNVLVAGTTASEQQARACVKEGADKMPLY